MKIEIPAFGETAFSENRENAAARVVLMENAAPGAFDAYCSLLEENGFRCMEAYTQGAHRYAAYYDGERGVFLNDFASIHRLSVVEEENCRYFAFADVSAKASVPAQITQVTLEDYGISYVIRLTDGRFIVFDGGREFEPDEDRLFACLKEGAMGGKPVIAAWILTHPHSDHFHCMIGFMERYGEMVTVEKFLFNFPEPDDYEHYPTLGNKDKRFEDSSATTNIPKMLEQVERSGAAVYMPHTGQRYRIGDAALEILSCMDDTIHCSKNVNATSLVIRMELAGQVILWAADVPFSDARLPERYGEYLKADILQIPHHGFQSGTAAAEIRGYELIQPRVCFLPVSEHNAFTIFCIYREGTRYLMSKAGVEELITGSVQRTLTLPYTPPAYAKWELEQRYFSGLDNAGSCTWMFSGLNTGREADFRFTILNTTVAAATVWIELFFEDAARKVRFIKASIPSGCFRQVNIVGEDVDDDAIYFGYLSLKKQGIPENAPFAVRFMSDIPVVVSHPDHPASYHTADNRITRTF